MSSSPEHATRRQTTGNRLLAALPDSERNRLSSRLVRVRLTSKQVLYSQGQLIHRVYFPDSGVVLLLPVMDDGELAGVGLVGNEGVVGVHALYPSATMPCEAVVQCPGEAWALSADDLRREVRAGGVFADLLGRYSHALLDQTMQAAACSALHAIRQRTARWILAIDQRTDGASFPLTQEVLGNVVGVRRATINAVARDFHRLGLIEYRRGRMRVRNRRRLLAASCECRLVMQAHFARLLPRSPRHRRGEVWRGRRTCCRRSRERVRAVRPQPYRLRPSAPKTLWGLTIIPGVDKLSGALLEATPDAMVVVDAGRRSTGNFSEGRAKKFPARGSARRAGPPPRARC